MPILVEEKFDSRSLTTGNNATAELTYLVSGTDDDIAAKAALAATAPGGHDGLVRDSVQVEYYAEDRWVGTAHYQKQENQQSEPPETGDSVYSFDTGGGTQHITQSRENVGKYAPPGKTAPDFKGAIGVTHDSVEGVDITTPVYNFAETHYIANEAVTGAYKAALFNLTGKVNNGGFRGFAAGEVLFLGASGSVRGAGDWEITYRFAASPNRANFTVGDITVTSKKGWEYMWVRYADAEDAAAKALVKKPIAVYIEKVYPDGDFSGLGI